MARAEPPATRAADGDRPGASRPDATSRGPAAAPSPEPRGALRALRAIGAVLVRLPRPVAAAVAAGWMSMIWQLSGQTIEVAERSLLWAVLGNGVHVPLFGLLALWLALTLPRSGESGWPRLRGAGAPLVVALTLGYGVVDEWHQGGTGRSSDLRDVVTDLCAATWVVVVATYAGDRGASERGAARRLWLGSLVCVASACVATLPLD